MSEQTETKRGLVENNNQFAASLYTEVAGDEENAGKNLFLSPFSISSALAMTYAGAREETEAEMAEVLHFGPQDELHQSFREVIEELNAGGEKGGYQLAVANRLFGQEGFEFVQDFLDLVAACYDGGLELLNFVSDTEGARIRINAWIADKTNDKIQDLIPPNVLSPVTRLVLTNAIYFKGNWENQFKEEHTQPETFTCTDGETVTVPLMYQKTKFGYYKGDTFQALELPYINEALSMLVFLPNMSADLNRLEERIPELLKLAEVSDTTPFVRKKVETYLPKFKTTFSTSLKEVLESLGMTASFGQGANFTGLAENALKEELAISDVIHKAFIEVNEEGTEAAAATAVANSYGCSMPAPDPMFRADHPFLFLIRDNTTGSVLFMGRIEDPTNEEE